MIEPEVELKAINVYGWQNQLIKAMEEAAELIQAIAKTQTTKPSSDEEAEKLYEAVLEEAADVEIMLDQIKLIYYHGAERVQAYKTYKLKRLARRLWEAESCNTTDS